MFDQESIIYDTYRYPNMKNQKVYDIKDVKNLFFGYSNKNYR